MNWFDFVLLAALALGALYGLKMGLIKAVFITVGVYVGWLLAGQWSDDLGGLFGSVGSDTIVTVISYAIIVAGALIAASYAAKFAKPFLTVFTLGLSSLVDRLGGLVLGLLIGVAISGALIVGFARLTYNFDASSITDLAPTQVSGQVAEQLARVEDVRESLETALTGSLFVATFLDVTDALPGNALGYIPSDFKLALDILKKNIE